MRSDFPPGGKRVGDWVGMRVRSKVALRNGNSELPAGTVYRVTYARSGLTLESEQCKCCGIKQYIRRVHPRDVEAVPAGVQASDAPSRAEAWSSWDEAERISNVPAVEEAIGNLLEDQTGDNATCLVRAVLDAAGVEGKTNG